MKIKAFIPIWKNYQNIDSNFNPLQVLGSKTLLERSIQILNQIDMLDDIIIFSSDKNIISHIFDKDLKYSFLNRNKNLDTEDTSIEAIIENFIDKCDVDIIVLIHPKSPFLKKQTICSCINEVINNNHDSSFIATSLKKHAWFEGKRLNYQENKDTPHTKYIKPVIIETCSFYVIRKDFFQKNRQRIGYNPFIKEVGHFEGFEVESSDDLKMAELIINAGLNQMTE